jgi:hypothetical protein
LVSNDASVNRPAASSLVHLSFSGENEQLLRTARDARNGNQFDESDSRLDWEDEEDSNKGDPIAVTARVRSAEDLLVRREASLKIFLPRSDMLFATF